MKHVFAAIFAGLFCLTARAEDWTVSGKAYHNVKVGQVEAYRVHITYDGGIGAVMLADLSPELQKRFGYNPDKAKAAIAKKEEEEKPDWEKVPDKLLAGWIDKIKKVSDTAATAKDISWAKLEQTKIQVLSIFLANGTLDVTQPSAKEWIDDVMNEQICVGMSKQLVELSWGEPHSKTTDSSAFGDSETWNYGNFDSLVFFSNGTVTNITQTQAAQN